MLSNDEYVDLRSSLEYLLIFLKLSLTEYIVFRKFQIQIWIDRVHQLKGIIMWILYPLLGSARSPSNGHSHLKQDGENFRRSYIT